MAAGSDCLGVRKAVGRIGRVSAGVRCKSCRCPRDVQMLVVSVSESVCCVSRCVQVLAIVCQVYRCGNVRETQVWECGQCQTSVTPPDRSIPIGVWVSAFVTAARH